MAATILLYAAIAALVLPRTRAWWRWLFVAAAVLMPLWVALSRMYRGMHHPTDVLGSVVLAACWLAAMLYFVRPNCDVGKRSRSPRVPLGGRSD
jgi:undecaprenyl-diphosphatase